jgi:ubiquinone/menaquinone biosynthesis C-methylase UbiE
VSADQAEYDLRYRDEFWPGREYEDRCDRIAIRALLPPTGERLVEVGAGFGRLAGEYDGYRSVVLFDESEVLLDAARGQVGGDARFEFALGDARQLPFADATFDTVVCVRVIHHIDDPGPALREFARVLRPGGSLVLEFANKHHLKAIARWALRRQRWSPFSEEPYQYLPLHFDHSPRLIRRLLREAGFTVGAQRAVSLFRLGALTGRVSPRLLAGLERPLQAPLGGLAIGPSVYLRATRI